MTGWRAKVNYGESGWGGVHLCKCCKSFLSACRYVQVYVSAANRIITMNVYFVFLVVHVHCCLCKLLFSCDFKRFHVLVIAVGPARLSETWLPFMSQCWYTRARTLFDVLSVRTESWKNTTTTQPWATGCSMGGRSYLLLSRFLRGRKGPMILFLATCGFGSTHQGRDLTNKSCVAHPLRLNYWKRKAITVVADPRNPFHNVWADTFLRAEIEEVRCLWLLMRTSNTAAYETM